MGKMKELYIEICEANGGIFPGEAIRAKHHKWEMIKPSYFCER